MLYVKKEKKAPWGRSNETYFRWVAIKDFSEEVSLKLNTYRMIEASQEKSCNCCRQREQYKQRLSGRKRVFGTAKES